MQLASPLHWIELNALQFAADFNLLNKFVCQQRILRNEKQGLAAATNCRVTGCNSVMGSPLQYLTFPGLSRYFRRQFSFMGFTIWNVVCIPGKMWFNLYQAVESPVAISTPGSVNKFILWAPLCNTLFQIELSFMGSSHLQPKIPDICSRKWPMLEKQVCILFNIWHAFFFNFLCDFLLVSFHFSFSVTYVCFPPRRYQATVRSKCLGREPPLRFETSYDTNCCQMCSCLTEILVPLTAVLSNNTDCNTDTCKYVLVQWYWMQYWLQMCSCPMIVTADHP